MAGHQGPGRLIIEYLLVYVLDKKGEREANSIYSLSPGDQGILSPNIPPSGISSLAFLLDHSVLWITNLDFKWVLCAEVWEEDVTCRPRESHLCWELDLEKSLSFLRKKTRNSIIIATFYWAPTMPGTLHTSVLVLPTTTWEVGIIITTLHVRKLRLSEVKQLAQGHAACRWVVESALEMGICECP